MPYKLFSRLALSFLKVKRIRPESAGMERATGFEPATTCLGSRNSTTELHPLRYDSIILAHPHACQEGTGYSGISVISLREISG